MKYKLISVDLDGTLLNDNKEISSKTIKRINELIKEGLIFVITTGRPFTGTKRYLDLFPFDNPVILYNGAVIRYSINNKLLYSNNLSEDDVKKIISIIKEKEGTYIYWKHEVPYVNRIDDYIDKYVKISKVMPKIDDELYQDVTKIIWFSESDKHKEYEKTLFNDLPNVNHFTSDATYLEFVSKDVSKGNALKKLCESYHISPEEVIAIGDGNNDISMIEYAKVGVAMANASNNVKEKANVITSSNNEEGVLKILNAYF